MNNHFKTIDIGNNLGVDNKYLDKEFSCSKKSILGSHVGDYGVEMIEWKRPNKFLNENYKLFDGVIESLDIKQGKLGNCYLLSALASIS